MDPTEYTASDRNYDRLAAGMPDISEVSAAVLALIKAVRKLEQSSIVNNVETAEYMADFFIGEITESVKFDEHEDFKFVGYDIFEALLKREKASWMAAINRDETDAGLTEQTIDLAGVVKSILGGQS